MDNTISDGEFADIARQLMAFRPDPDRRYTIEMTSRQGCFILALVGTVMQPIPTEFGFRLDELFTYENARRTIIDLSRCDYLSSASFGVLVEVFKASTERGGQVLLVNPSEKLQKLLVILGLDNYFLRVEDLQTAIDYLLANPRPAP